MSEQKIDTVIKSSDIAKTKLVVYDGKLQVDMNGDQRLDKLVQTIEKEIGSNGWQVPQNEKEISSRIVQLTHSDQFYGKYNPQIGKNSTEVEKTLKSIHASGINRHEDNKSPAETDKIIANLKKETAILEKETAILEKASQYYDSRGNKLKDYPAGTLVCREEAAVVSYVMERVGIHNDFCATPGYNASNHAFVQSRVTGNIIEATDPRNPYRVNVSDTYIREGQIVITKAGDSPIHTYGNGSVKFNVDLKKAIADIKKDPQAVAALEFFSEHSKPSYEHSMDLAMGSYEKRVETEPRQHFDNSQPITVLQAETNIVREYADMDKGKHILGIIPSGGKFDGVITGQESLEAALAGRKVKGHIAPKGLEEIHVVDFVRTGEWSVKSMDKNHDGILNRAEIDKGVDERTKDLLKYQEEKHLKPMSPLQIQNFKQHVLNEIYGNSRQPS